MKLLMTVDKVEKENRPHFLMKVVKELGQRRQRSLLTTNESKWKKLSRQIKGIRDELNLRDNMVKDLVEDK